MPFSIFSSKSGNYFKIGKENYLFTSCNAFKSCMSYFYMIQINS
jgi:hypothetical protein